jgi:very-short-patch-repair endonuclease
MADIWQRVTDEAADATASAIYGLRTAPEFQIMESEIERALAASVAIHCMLSGMRVVFAVPTSPMAERGIFIAPQYQIDNYRVDFLMGATYEPLTLSKCLVVECDGHDWHERTKEQAARDKSRDRHLSTRVGRGSRFTGSEIFRTPAVCAADAIKVLGAAMGFAQI